jgi:hypothetical protein
MVINMISPKGLSWRQIPQSISSEVAPLRYIGEHQPQSKQSETLSPNGLA